MRFLGLSIVLMAPPPLSIHGTPRYSSAFLESPSFRALVLHVVVSHLCFLYFLWFVWRSLFPRHCFWRCRLGDRKSSGLWENWLLVLVTVLIWNIDTDELHSCVTVPALNTAISTISSLIGFDWLTDSLTNRFTLIDLSLLSTYNRRKSAQRQLSDTTVAAIDQWLRTTHKWSIAIHCIYFLSLYLFFSVQLLSCIQDLLTARIVFDQMNEWMKLKKEDFFPIELGDTRWAAKKLELWSYRGRKKSDDIFIKYNTPVWPVFENTYFMVFFFRFKKNMTFYVFFLKWRIKKS